MGPRLNLIPVCLVLRLPGTDRMLCWHGYCGSNSRPVSILRAPIPARVAEHTGQTNTPANPVQPTMPAYVLGFCGMVWIMDGKPARAFQRTALPHAVPGRPLPLLWTMPGGRKVADEKAVRAMPPEVPWAQLCQCASVPVLFASLPCLPGR